MKMTRKILISVLTAGCLASAAFGLAACGGGDETGETPATPSGDYVVYTVTFDTNGGTLLPEQGAEAGDKAVKPGDPKKAGYTFGGWYTNATCTQAYDFNSTITGDTTIYAKWNAAPTTDAGYFRLTQDGEGWSVAAMPGKIMPTDVVIPDKIDDKTITSVSVSGFEDVGNIQSVTLPDTVTTIGQRAFRNCTDLEVVLGGSNVQMIDSDAFDNTAWDNSLPAGEVYLGKTFYKYASSIFVETEIDIKDGTVGIASGAFLNQPNLVGVTLPEGLKYIGSYAFGADAEENGNGVTEVVLPDSVVEVGAGAFRYAPIETLIIGKGVEYIGAKAFAGTDVTYLEFNAANGVIADATFDGLTSPATVKIADEVKTFPENLVKGWDGIVSLDLGAGITVIPAGALDGHTALSEVNFGSIVRIGGNAFRGTSLTEVVLPASLSRLGNNAFANCENLETVTVNAEKVGISGSAFPAFAGDEKLTSVKFGATVREIPDYLFYQNVNLSSVAFAQGIEKIGMYAFYGTSLSGKLVLPEGLKYIGDHAFDAGDDSTNPGYGTTPLANLQGVVVPTTVEEIGSEAFANNRTLTYVAWNAVTVKTSVYTPRDSFTVNELKSIFSGCKDLKYVTIGSAVKSLPEQFIKGCNKVDEVDLGSGSIEISANAFEGCTALVSLGAANGSGISDVGTDAFKGTPWYNALLSANDGKAYYIGKVLMGIAGTVADETYTLTVNASNCTRIADNAFKNDKKLTKITFSGSRGSIVIGASAFEGCTGLTGTLSTGSNVVEIGSRAFYGCSGLTALTLTNVVTIGDSAFQNCSKLYTEGDFTIPATVKTIGKSAFYSMKLVGRLTTASGSVLEKIDNQAFYNANPTEIVLSDTCTYLGTQWINNASNTTKFEAPGVTYAGNLPFGSSPIAEDFNFDQYTEIGSLSGWKRTEYVFENLTKIGTSFLGGGVNSSKQTVTGNAYVERVTFKQPIEEIPKTAFAGTTKLEEVILEHPEALKTIGDQAFHSSAIKTIDLSYVTSFGDGAFAKSYIQLHDFTFSEDLEHLGESAFHAAYDVTGSITIRGKLDTIGQSAFEDVPVTKIVIGGSVKTVGQKAFARMGDTQWWRPTTPPSATSEDMYITEVIFEEGVENIDPQAFRLRKGEVVSLPSTVLTVGGYGAADAYTAEGMGFRGFKVVKLAGYIEPTDLNTPTPAFVDSMFFLTENDETAEKIKGSAVWNAYRANVYAASELIDGDWLINKDGKVLKYLGDLKNISIPAEAKSMDDISAVLGTQEWNYGATITAAAESGFKVSGGVLTDQSGTVLYLYGGSAAELTDGVIKEVKPYAFYGNKTVTSVTLNEAETFGVNAFTGSAVATLVLPKLKVVGAHAFENVTSFTTVTLENATEIGESAFSGCSNLANFNFSKVTAIGDSAFDGCAFVDVDLEAIVTIGDMAFRSNSKLANVTIGANCTSIGASAFTTTTLGFANADGVVIVKATTPPTGTNMFARIAAQMKATIKVPSSAVEAYKAAEGWSTYADKIQAAD